MGTRRMFRWGPLSVALAGALSLLLVAGGSAAVPKAAKLYTGPLATSSYHGFTPSVSFTVSRNARQLLRFTWAGGGCTGLGGPGNAYASPGLNYKLGTINVSRTGGFSIKHVKTTATIGPGVTKTTISTVNGRFKNATTAIGTISFTQTLNRSKPCSGKVTFTAILGPAPGALHKISPSNRATVAGIPVLRWTASRHATSYKYCLTPINSDTCNHWVSTHASTHATPSGLKPGSTYYWQVLASSVHGTVAADNGYLNRFTIAATTITPKAGHWLATSLTGPVSGGGGSTDPGNSVTVTRVFFTVAGDQATVTGFGFDYDYSGPSSTSNVCVGHGSTADQTAASVTKGAFSTPAQNSWSDAYDYGTFRGTFDSPTQAHGIGWLRGFINGFDCRYVGYANTGNFSWTATWQS